jgi:hypothetical protein
MSESVLRGLPFVRTEWIVEGELVGARWWHESMRTGMDPVTRRAALVALGGGTALALGVGVAAWTVTSAPRPSPAVRVTTEESLSAQKELGWNVGAGTTELTFDGESAEPFDRERLDHMYEDLAPSNAAFKPYYVATLFQSLTATPVDHVEGDPFRALKETIRPVLTDAMKVTYLQGRAMASLFEEAPTGRAVMVDLPGPEAVAFAMGLAERLDPVFTFDGWPHPQGVVPAHMTLAAAAYYQTAFARARARDRPTPAFILDRGRLLPYQDESDRFDNRYVAKVPDAEHLGGLGVTQLLYVSHDGVEADDLNEDFVAYDTKSIEIRHVAPSDFSPPDAATDADAGTNGAKGAKGADGSYDSGGYYYGGHPRYHWYFWTLHGWGTPRYAYRPFSGSIIRPVYQPMSRTTLFSGRARPAGFGSVGIVRSGTSSHAVGTTRCGSWGRGAGGGG